LNFSAVGEFGSVDGVGSQAQIQGLKEIRRSLEELS